MQEDLEALGQQYRALMKQLENLRPRLAAAIIKEAKAGTRQTEIVRKSSYTRERVRQICRGAGIEPL
jgi:predicted transcriptional regulator